MNKQMLTIEVVIDQSIEVVWQLWTLPEHIVHWNFASDDWQCSSASNDLSIGGKYIARMEAKDASFRFDLEAIYDEIVLYKRIIYTMLDDRQAVTTFTPISGQVKITTTFDAELEYTEAEQKDGWQSILNNFKKYAEAYL